MKFPIIINISKITKLKKHFRTLSTSTIKDNVNYLREVSFKSSPESYGQNIKYFKNLKWISFPININLNSAKKIREAI